MFYSLDLLSLLSMFSSCSKDDFNTESELNQNEVSINFSGQIVNRLTSRTALGSETTPKELCIVAYRKMGDNSYVYAKHMNATSTVSNNEVNWSNPEFKLRVGTYRFLGFYNINQQNTQLDLTFATETSEKDWNAILNAVVISRKATNQSLDINEIFAGGSSDNKKSTANSSIAENVDLSEQSGGNAATVNLNLSRVNARIDFRFLKFSPGDSGSEQHYTDANYTIFGPKRNLTSLTITTSNASNSWTWGTTPS